MAGGGVELMDRPSKQGLMGVVRAGECGQWLLIIGGAPWMGVGGDIQHELESTRSLGWLER